MTIGNTLKRRNSRNVATDRGKSSMPNAPLIEDIEARILRAILTLFVVPTPDARFVADIRSWWPETFDPWDYPTEAKKKLYEPNREDMDRYLDDLTWLRALHRNQIKLIILRALGLSYVQISGKWGRSDEHWRRRYKEALAVITDAARRPCLRATG